MKIGFLKRTPRGRVVTENVYAHLGLDSSGEKGNKGGNSSIQQSLT